MSKVYKWTQPICLKCYVTRYPDRSAVGIVEVEKERCCDCGKDTYEGVYFRVNPATVQFPTEERK